ncbi:histidine kinase [Bacillus sp. CGMCC 1.16607]|uniref:histidine kinase n=1 Tax=Bacillus sp. CGMCC 1.16607 TaxID=3351842 RepID=UPI0036411502
MSKEILIFPKRYGFMPFVWLVYVLFPVFSLINEDGLKQIIGFIMILLFLVTYRQLYFATTNQSFSWWLAIQLGIVFLFSVFYHLNYLFLGFFPANFIGWYRDPKMFKLGFLGLVFVELIPVLYYLLSNQFDMETKDILYVFPFMIIMFISPFGIRSMNKRADLEKKLDQANQQIKELVKREERLRIARDLHDTLGHTLSLLTLKSQLVQRLTSADPDRAKLEAKEMEHTSRAALKQVRELVTDMRAASIPEEILQVQQILKTANINHYYSGETDFSETISPFTENIICMCLKEATTNVVKHSRSKNCFITIQKTADRLKVIVRDDGMGVANLYHYGNGLTGMKERLELINGTLIISNQNGTVVELTVPIIEKVEKEGTAV